MESQRLQYAYSFEIPIHWSFEYVNCINKLSLKYAASEGKITSMYGTLNCGGFNSGRIKLDHQNLSFKEAKDILTLLKESGYEFYYLLNAPLERDTDSNDIRKLEKLFNNIECSAVVVADLGLAKLIHRYFPHIAIHISTVANIFDFPSLEPWLSINPKRVILPHDIPKKLGDLRSLLALLKKNNIVPVMMVTESCLFECPWRNAHYQTLGKGLDDSSFHERCQKRRYEDPIEFFLPGSFVRPQDIDQYVKKCNIRYFKLSGRSQTEGWKLKTAEAYLSGHYSGNLLSLMGMDPKCSPSRSFYMDSSFLDDYISQLFSGEDNVKLGRKYAKTHEITYGTK